MKAAAQKVVLSLLLVGIAFALYGGAQSYFELGAFQEWCAAQNGTVIPDTYCLSDDGRILLAPEDRDGRWG